MAGLDAEFVVRPVFRNQSGLCENALSGGGAGLEAEREGTAGGWCRVVEGGAQIKF